MKIENDDDDNQIAAKALITVAHGVMTGHEIHICESLAKNASYFLPGKVVDYCECEHCKGHFKESAAPDGEAAFASLCIQFSREIGEWIATQQKHDSRLAV